MVSKRQSYWMFSMFFCGFLCIGFALNQYATAQDTTDKPAAAPNKGTEGTIDVDGRTFKYAIYVPDGKAPEAGRPLLICLHGAGFTGKGYLKRWIERLDDKYVLVCPTFTRDDSEGAKIWGHWWSDRAERYLLALIDKVADEQKVDKQRIVFAGMSNGGVGAYYFAIRHPHLFSAVVPMAGAVPTEDVKRLVNLSSVSVCLIHGSKDKVMPVSDTDKANEELKKVCSDLKYVRHDWVHPQAGGHFFPRQAIPELVEWLDDKKRQPYPKHLHIRLDNEHTQRVYWVEPVKADESWQIEADQADNKIAIKTDGVAGVKLFLSKEWINFDNPVEVSVNGKVVFSDMVKPDADVRSKSGADTQLGADPYDAELTVSIE